jgi:glycosyltransferase involved in cell wall biosynthesis
MIPKLSIITINLNNCIGLEKTMNSVLTQSYGDYEYIIIDGGSTDSSAQVIKRFEKVNKDTTKIVWLSEPDKGVYHAMNKGIDLAHGEYILFLNSGDSLVGPEILHTIFSTSFSEDYVYGNLNLIRDEVLCYQDVKMDCDVPTLFNLYKESLPHQASFIKRNLFEKYGKYDEKSKITGDWEFCIRVIILNNCSVRHIPFTISNYDLGGISSLNIEGRNTERDEVLSRYFTRRIIDDYEYWSKKEREIEIMVWYKQHHFLYGSLVFIYKVIALIRKLTK